MHRRIATLLLLAALAVPAVLPLSPAKASTSSNNVALLAEKQKVRIRALGALANDAPIGIPFRRIDATSGWASIILPARETPYTIQELIARFPTSFQRLNQSTILVQEDIIVGENARLVISSDQIRRFLLWSDTSRFVTITSWGGTIDIRGSPLRRLVISSWDATALIPDRVLDDGRAWIHTRRGTLNIRWTTLQYLGFYTGSLSGVAWEGRPEDPSRGDVIGSRFRQNYFGAYTFEAVGMRWIGNVFDESRGYGFDPHDHSDHFVVQFNLAYRNGSHGIIFSRGCRYNRIRWNMSLRNNKHGIVLDNGPNLNPDGTPRERQGIPSDNNLVASNIVIGNQVGIVQDGGTRNEIRGNILLSNRYGVRMKDAVNGNAVIRNIINNTEEFAIYLYQASDNNYIAENRLYRAKTGVVISNSMDNTITRNVIAGMASRGFAFTGYVGNTTLSRNTVRQTPRPLDTSGVDAASTIRSSDNLFEHAQDRSLPPVIVQWLAWSVVLLIPVLLGPWLTRAFGALQRQKGKPIRTT